MKKSTKILIVIVLVIGIVLAVLLSIAFLLSLSELFHERPNLEIIREEGGYHADTYEVKLTIKNKGGAANFTIYCEVERYFNKFYEKQTKPMYLARNEQKNVTFTFYDVPYGLHYKVWFRY